jgi:putative FmdB family regulatory protein
MRILQAFKCNTCNAEFERLVERGHLAPCDTCHSLDVVRVITAPAIKVTGQGAYSQKMKTT